MRVVFAANEGAYLEMEYWPGEVSEVLSLT